MADEIKDLNKEEGSPIIRDSNLYGAKINPIPVPERNIGIDTDSKFFDNIIQAGESSQLDLTTIDSFSQISQNRNLVYNVLDTMAEDSRIAAILEYYAEDSTEMNEEGKIVWCESDDTTISKYINFLIDELNIDKHIYKWSYSLCKYGDLYLKLYRESEYNNDIFSDEEIDKTESPKSLNEDLKAKHEMAVTTLENALGRELTENEANVLWEDSVKKDIEEKSETLDESILVRAFSKNDRYAHYLEMMPNPAEMFELTQFGKTYAYIQAPTSSATKKQKDNMMYTNTYNYFYKKHDIKLYSATEFVHACLEDNSSRTPEQIHIFKTDDENADATYSYIVRRGQSLLYNSFKDWRNLSLLENSLLLSRLTKSSIVRVINVEVGDMPKESIGPHLMKIKQLIEQKSAIEEGNSLTEYTNPGPIENNVYIPTHNGQGTITTNEIGGEVNPGTLTDIDNFKNKLFAGLRVPKQYLGETDDSTGFNGGTALSLISSSYAKMIKRIQSTLIQILTDAINLMLLDKGLDSYINKFEIHMLPPMTEDDVNRRDNMDSRVGIINNIMGLLSNVEDQGVQLKILKSLLGDVLSNQEILNILQEEIDKLEAEQQQGEDLPDPDEILGDEDMDDLGDDGFDFSPMPSGGHSSPSPSDLGGGDSPKPKASKSDDSGSVDDIPSGDTGGRLPSPADLGMDFTDMNMQI